MGFRVVGIDTGEEKKELVMRLGAEGFVDFKTSSNVIEEVKKITGLMLQSSSLPVPSHMKTLSRWFAQRELWLLLDCPATRSWELTSSTRLSVV
jgi:D-arabinose 1-dehydrogenase-like Zn-dependent alcohol dehydrogenase